MTSSVGVDIARPERMDVRFGKVEKRIHYALNDVLSMRKIDIQSGEFCQMAQISRPTLRAHCVKVDDALQHYEQGLREKFRKQLEIARKERAIFVIMLSLIRNEKRYFFATVPNHNYWLLNTIFDDLRVKLADASMDDLDYELYTHRQIALIGYWVKRDSCASEKIPYYATRLEHTKSLIR